MVEYMCFIKNQRYVEEEEVTSQSILDMLEGVSPVSDDVSKQPVNRELAPEDDGPLLNRGHVTAFFNAAGIDPSTTVVAVYYGDAVRDSVYFPYYTTFAKLARSCGAEIRVVRPGSRGSLQWEHFDAVGCDEEFRAWSMPVGTTACIEVGPVGLPDDDAVLVRHRLIDDAAANGVKLLTATYSEVSISSRDCYIITDKGVIPHNDAPEVFWNDVDLLRQMFAPAVICGYDMLRAMRRIRGLMDPRWDQLAVLARNHSITASYAFRTGGGLTGAFGRLPVQDQQEAVAVIKRYHSKNLPQTVFAEELLVLAVVASPEIVEQYREEIQGAAGIFKQIARSFLDGKGEENDMFKWWGREFVERNKDVPNFWEAFPFLEVIRDKTKD